MVLLDLSDAIFVVKFPPLDQQQAKGTGILPVNLRIQSPTCLLPGKSQVAFITATHYEHTQEQQCFMTAAIITKHTPK